MLRERLVRSIIVMLMLLVLVPATSSAKTEDVRPSDLTLDLKGLTAWQTVEPYFRVLDANTGRSGIVAYDGLVYRYGLEDKALTKAELIDLVLARRTQKPEDVLRSKGKRGSQLADHLQGFIVLRKHPLWFVKPIFTYWLVKPGAPQYQWLLAVLGDFLILGGALFFLLRMVPSRFRKTLVAIVTFLAGLIYSVEFFVPVPAGRDGNFLTNFAQKTVTDVVLVLSTFALGLGIYSLLRFHGRNLARRRPGWHNSLALYVAFFAMLLTGFWSMMSKAPAAANTFDTLFRGTVAAPGATMFSIIAFYIVSAAYRAFRIRSAEATLMLTAAFVVMLGSVPVGEYLTSGLPATGFWSNFRMENVNLWILKEPNMAAWRGISFGVEIGALAMALRTWLSLERGSFFEREL